MNGNLMSMQFDEVIEQAKMYGRAEEEILQLLANLQNTQNNLQGVWQGQAMSAFEQQYAELIPKVREFAQLMKAIEKQVTQIAMAFKEMDAQISANILKDN